jgi:hypothetical protein
MPTDEEIMRAASAQSSTVSSLTPEQRDKVKKQLIQHAITQTVMNIIPALILFGLWDANKDKQCDPPLADWLLRTALLMVGGVVAFVPIFLSTFGMMRGWVQPTTGAKLSCLFCCLLMPLGGYSIYWYIQGNIWVCTAQHTAGCDSHRCGAHAVMPCHRCGSRTRRMATR